MPDATVLDQQRKRHLFTACAVIVITAFAVLAVFDYLEGDVLENLINLAVICTMAAGLAAVRKWGRDAAVYRLSHFLICLLLLYCVSIAAGRETVLYWVLIMPLLFFAFFGKREGMLWALLFSAGLGLIMIAPGLFGSHVYGDVTISRFLITLSMAIVVAYHLESSRHTFGRLLDEKNQALLREKQSLEAAMARIRTLRGLLPICASCKRIRDDKGYWNQLEAYLSEHSEVVFSHGICPECKEKLYSQRSAPQDP